MSNKWRDRQDEIFKWVWVMNISSENVMMDTSKLALLEFKHKSTSFCERWRPMLSGWNLLTRSTTRPSYARINNSSEPPHWTMPYCINKIWPPKAIFKSHWWFGLKLLLQNRKTSRSVMQVLRLLVFNCNNFELFCKCMQGSKENWNIQWQAAGMANSRWRRRGVRVPSVYDTIDRRSLGKDEWRKSTQMTIHGATIQYRPHIWVIAGTFSLHWS